MGKERLREQYRNGKPTCQMCKEFHCEDAMSFDGRFVYTKDHLMIDLIPMTSDTCNSEQILEIEKKILNRKALQGKVVL